MKRTDKTTSTCFIVFILNCKIETKFITQFKNKYTEICLQLNKKPQTKTLWLLCWYMYTCLSTIFVSFF